MNKVRRIGVMSVFGLGMLTALVGPGTGGTASAQDTAPVCGGKTATIYGSNLLIGTSGPDVIIGTSGNDVIKGNGGDDFICGFDGDDTIYGGDGNDEIYGERYYCGGPGGTDTIYGDAGDDIIQDNCGINNVAYGGTGSDNLSIWGTADGGSGNDYVRVDGDYYYMCGGCYRGLAIGGSGNDTLFAYLGDADGGSGNDTIRLVESGDAARGGPGNDTLIDYNTYSPVELTFDGGSGRDKCESRDENDVLISCER